MRIDKIIAPSHIRIVPAEPSAVSPPEVANRPDAAPSPVIEPATAAKPARLVALTIIAGLLALLAGGLLVLPPPNLPGAAGRHAAEPAPATDEPATASAAIPGDLPPAPQPTVSASPGNGEAAWQDGFLAEVTAGTLAALRGSQDGDPARAAVLDAVRAARTEGSDDAAIGRMLAGAVAAQRLTLPPDWTRADGSADLPAILAALDGAPD
ncbi:MAG: hypothetical protein QNJ16_16975 [Rhodobacter sp.]|nr:hypothetical protein [Rhodobacter sp.]